MNRSIEAGAKSCRQKPRGSSRIWGQGAGTELVLPHGQGVQGMLGGVPVYSPWMGKAQGVHGMLESPRGKGWSGPMWGEGAQGTHG